MNVERATKLIEKRRMEINRLYEKGLYDQSLLLDDDLLEKSRKLDQLLNKYDKMLSKKN